MSGDYGYYRRDPRFTVGSGLLLAIFVGAVLFVAYMAYTMAPWESDPDDPATEPAVAETDVTSPDDAADEAAGEGDATGE